jgi:hypothetical protein
MLAVKMAIWNHGKKERFTVNNHPLVNEKRHNPPKNVRFWEWINGSWVKITLPHGKEVLHGKSWDNGEGWSYERNAWSYSDGYIYCEWESGGSDCDGPISHNGATICKLDEIAFEPVYHDAPRRFSPGPVEWEFNGKHIMKPNWKKYRATRVHDVYAQQMGY